MKTTFKWEICRKLG